MFGLIYNFYKFCKKKSERKVTLALLGLDNAGKTTLLNTIKGELQEETTPTFGFNSSTLQEGKYTLEVFDLGGGKTFRSVWSKYLAEVHAVVYVVDAADAQRFEESKKALQEVLECQFMREKPILVYANKQDLPTASTAAEVVKGLGLSTCRNSHNVFPCTAKTAEGGDIDLRLREGLRWLIGCVDREYGRLDPRVQAEAEEVRQEEARKKKERDERIRLQREERLRLQKEEEDRAAEVEKENALNDGKAPFLLAVPASGQVGPQQTLQLPQQQQDTGTMQAQPGAPPHTIESPGKLPPPRRRVEAPQTSDLGRAIPDQGAAPPPSLGAGDSNGGAPPPARGTLPPLAPGNLAARPSSAQSRGSAEDGSGGGAAPSTSAVARAPSAGHGSVGSCGGRSGCSSPGRPGSAEARGEPGAADGSDERVSGQQVQRARLMAASSGGMGSGGGSDAGPRGSFSLVHQNKVVPVGG